jgi:hypothetical protein
MRGFGSGLVGAVLLGSACQSTGSDFESDSTAGGATGSAGSGARAGCYQGFAGSAPPNQPSMGYGVEHRTSPPTCSDEGLDVAGDQAALPRADETLPCTTDADCKAFRYGACKQFPRGESAPESFCTSHCTIDDDCDADQICWCPDSYRGSCQASQCRTDFDCEAGYWCRRLEASLVGRPMFACDTSLDECRSDANCQDLGRGTCDLAPALLATPQGEVTIQRRACSMACPP